MGHYISIRGWLDCPENRVSVAKDILAAFIDKAGDYGLTRDGAEMYNRGWVIPDSHINWTYYMFFGADIRIQYLNYIRDQIVALTDEVKEIDGEDVDRINGVFDLEDDEQAIFFTWRTQNGQFTEAEGKR